MTWTATERHDKAIDISDDERWFCAVYPIGDGPAAVQQMRARARLIVQAEAMRGMLKVVLDWVSNWDPNFADDDEWIEDRDAIRAIIKATQEQDSE